MGNQNIFQLPKRTPAGQPSWVRFGYGCGVAFLVMGAVVFGISGGSVWGAFSRGAHQVQLPGSATLNLKEGVYVGLPGPGFAGDGSGLFVTVTDDATGENVAVQSAAESTVMVQGKGLSRPLFQFEIFDNGRYTLTGVSSSPAGSMPVMVLHESMGRTRTDLVVGLLAGSLLIGGGIAALFFTWRQARRRELISSPPV